METGKVPDEESVLRMKEALGGISDPRRQWGYLRRLPPLRAGPLFPWTWDAPEKGGRYRRRRRVVMYTGTFS